MALPKSGKLVRDRIPEIVAASGGAPTVVVLSEEDSREALHLKLIEEAGELRDASDESRLEELAEVSVSVAANPTTNPDAVGRGLRAHRKLQNGLAATVTESGGDPLAPTPLDPNFDLAWYVDNHHLVVCEMKSLTVANEIHQLRLGLGQVLDYAHALRSRVDSVTPVLYVPRAPTDQRWMDIADSVGVLLRWPANHEDYGSNRWPGCCQQSVR